MPYHKITMLLQQSKAGWSESFYTEASGPAQAIVPIQSAGLLRRRLLATDALIIGYRAQEVERTGQVLVVTVDEPAILGTNKDPVYNSLLLSCRTSDGLKRQYYLRGIPDNASGLGRFAPNGTYQTNLNQYLGIISNGLFRVRRVVRSNLPVPIATVSGVGLVTFFAAHGLVVGNTVQFLNTRDTARHAVQGKFRVLAVPSATTMTVSPWDADRLVTTGLVRKVEYAYPPITSVTHDSQIVSRKVGRPFGAPRGRRSVRR